MTDRYQRYHGNGEYSVNHALMMSDAGVGSGAAPDMTRLRLWLLCSTAIFWLTVTPKFLVER